MFAQTYLSQYLKLLRYSPYTTPCQQIIDLTHCTEDPRYNDSICYQRLCCKIEFAIIKKLDMDTSKAGITDSFEQFFYNHKFCVFVRIASAMRFKQISKTYVFLLNNKGLSIKKVHDSLIFVQI